MVDRLKNGLPVIFSKSDKFKQFIINEEYLDCRNMIFFFF